MQIKNKYLFIITFILIGLLTGIFVDKVFLNRCDQQSPVISQIEKIKSLHKIEFVRFHYSSIQSISVGENDNTALITLIIPMKTCCYIDFQNTEFTVQDSLIRIKLPQPEIDDPEIKLDSVIICDKAEKKVNLVESTYNDAYKNIHLALSQSKKELRPYAEASGILDETTTLGKQYLVAVFSSMGYSVDFISENGGDEN